MSFVAHYKGKLKNKLNINNKSFTCWSLWARASSDWRKHLPAACREALRRRRNRSMRCCLSDRNQLGASFGGTWCWAKADRYKTIELSMLGVWRFSFPKPNIKNTKISHCKILKLLLKNMYSCTVNSQNRQL